MPAGSSASGRMTTVTAPTIAEFILARIAEDEALAQAASRDRYSVDGGLRYGDTGYNTLPDLTIDPARMLAECEAKRRIVELADEATGLDMKVDSEFAIGPRDEESEPYIGDVILRTLAAVFADHPDYDEGWRVE